MSFSQNNDTTHVDLILKNLWYNFKIWTKQIPLKHNSFYQVNIKPKHLNNGLPALSTPSWTYSQDFVYEANKDTFHNTLTGI